LKQKTDSEKVVFNQCCLFYKKSFIADLMGAVTLSITTSIIMALSIMTISITREKRDTQHK